MRATVDADPYDERSWFRLIAVLTAVRGREAGLVATDEATRTLASCGLELGRRLRDLERLVRDGERDIERLVTDRSRRSRPPEASTAAVLHEHVEWLMTLLDTDVPTHVQIHGPSRSGRSALADLAAIRAQRLGAATRTLAGCDFGGLPLPLSGAWLPRRRRVVIVDGVDRVGPATRRSLAATLAAAVAVDGPLLIVSTARHPEPNPWIDDLRGVDSHRLEVPAWPATATDLADERPGGGWLGGGATDAVRRTLQVLAVSELAVHRDDLATVVPGAPATRRAVLGTGVVRDRHDNGWWTLDDQDVRQAIVADLGGAGAARLHAELAAVTFVHDDDTTGTRRRARHALAAAGMHPAAAVDALAAAAEQARSVLDHQAAAALFDRASDVAAPVDPARSSGLSVETGRALLAAGDLAGLDVLERVSDQALAAGLPAVAAAAAHAFCRLGPSSSAGIVDARAAALADRVLVHLRDPADRALVAGATTMVHVFAGDPDHCRRHFRDALAAADECGRHDVLAEVLPFAYLTLAAPEDLDEREAIAGQLRGLADQLDRPDVRWEAAHLQFSNQLQRGDPACRSSAAKLVAIAAEADEATREWQMAYVRATVAYLDARLADAEAEITASLDIAGAVGPTRAMAVYGSVLLACRLAEGRVAELAPMVRDIAREQPLVPAWQAPLALAAATVGDRSVAAAAFDGLVGAGDRLPRDCTYTAALTMLGEAAALLGDHPRVDTAVDLLTPWSGRWSWTGTCTFGPIDLTLARLAEARGDVEGALRAAVAALRSAADMRSPLVAGSAADLVVRHA